jgi:hypothetical protein
MFLLFAQRCLVRYDVLAYVHSEMSDQLADVAAGRQRVVRQRIEVDAIEWPTIVEGGFANERILDLSAHMRSHDTVIEEIELRKKVQLIRDFGIGQHNRRCTIDVSH